MGKTWESSSSSSSGGGGGGGGNGIWRVVGIFQGSSSTSADEEYWGDKNIHIHGGWATIIALLLILVWQSVRRFFLHNRFRSLVHPLHSSSKPTTTTTTTTTPTTPLLASANPQIRISEIISDADLKILIDNLDEKPNVNEKWDNVIDKRNNLLSYSAKCCKPKDGPLKYSSVTVFENCSTEMLRDFYMDNDYRKQWDKTLVEHQQLQVDKTNGIEIGRTIKKFPLLTPREYILTWRVWEGKDKTFYCFIKECEHPSAPRQKKYVRVEFFRSGWRISKVPGRNACEIKMVHQEDAGLNVEIAKLAFAKGIWSYVCKMDNALCRYSSISHPRPSSASAATAVTLIQKVPPGLDTINSITCSSHSANSAAVANERKFSRRPSKKWIANGLLLLGGVICLSRGHSTLGAKVAMGYILKKLNKHGASSSQSRQS